MRRDKILIALAMMVATVACGSGEKTMEIRSAKVTNGAITNTVTATGTVEPVKEIEVGTQVSGIIDKIYVDYNDNVKAGQLLAEMDKVTLQVELEVSEAQLANAKTEYDYQTKVFNRTKQLHDKELVSDAEYDQALYNYEKSLNSYNQSKASIVKVRRNLEYASITSPIDGVIISRDVEEGQTVAAGLNTPKLFSLAGDLKQMRVIADVDEADIGQVIEGQKVEFTVDAYPDDTFIGEVEQVRIDAIESSNVITYEVVIAVSNPELKLKPGLTANIKILTLEKSDIAVIPTRALRIEPDMEVVKSMGLEMGAPIKGDKVWVKEGNRLIAKPVVLGASSGDVTQIVSGLNIGDDVVTHFVASGAPKGDEAPTTNPFVPQRPKK